MKFKSKVVLFLLVWLLVNPMATSSPGQSAGQHEMAIELLRLKEMTANSVEGLEGTDFDKAVAMRNHLYQRVQIGQESRNLDWMRPAEIYLQSLRGETDQLCGGLMLLYIAMLEAHNIPARYVGLFDSDVAPYNSHASVEFWYEGQWLASDPTFNAMYVADGRYLSYSDLYQVMQAGGRYQVVHNGYPIDPGRTEYLEAICLEAVGRACRFGFEELIRFVVIHPAVVWAEGERYEYEMVLLPKDWDGGVTMTTGERVDVRAYAAPYTLLPALRVQ